MTHLFVVDVGARTTRTLTERRVHRRQLRLVARRQAASRSTIASTATPRAAAPPTSRSSTVADASVRKLVTQDGPDSQPGLVARRHAHRVRDGDGEPGFFYSNSVIATVPAAGGAPAVLTVAFDEDPSLVAWKPSGLFFSASQRTFSYLFRLDPATQGDHAARARDAWIGSGFSLTRDGSHGRVPRRRTPRRFPRSTSRRVDDGASEEADRHERADRGAGRRSTLEVVSWKSQDGATIEGVLHKPAGLRAGRAAIRCSS